LPLVALLLGFGVQCYRWLS